jgi:4-alpha-glucanotransferase
MILNFYLRFSSAYGQALFITGNAQVMGNNEPKAAVPLEYLNSEYWHASIDLSDEEGIGALQYKYILREKDGEETIECTNDREVDILQIDGSNMVLYDTWSNNGDLRNVYYSQPFQQVFFKQKHKFYVQHRTEPYTHELRVKAPLLERDEQLCVAGSVPALNNWGTGNPILLEKKGNYWTIQLNLEKETFPIGYKYGIYNSATQSFIKFEGGNNRILQGDGLKKSITILEDGFVQLGSAAWKGAGVAIPVFSLRSKKSFGTGEFTDLILLADWAKETGLKLIQLLPLNDTTATHTNKDSYPYAAISAFALHPLFINLDKIAGEEYAAALQPVMKNQQQLNELPFLDYEQVMQLKNNAIKKLYKAQKNIFNEDLKYFDFFDLNRQWLVPYAAFCYLRDKNKTAEFTSWKTNSVYDEEEIQELVSPHNKQYDEIAVHYFTQYHLYLQLKEATAYAHKQGIIVKGDIPIGIFRNSVDAWMEPHLYNMNEQAGAPPDDFAVKGQNWGFPTYNWQAMQENNFAWWRQRFEQMSIYFDAFRIDHILGFFRIWSIPLHAVQGIMGRFVPAIPIHINEFFERRVSYERHRYCKPFFNDGILSNLFGDDTQAVKDFFLDGDTFKDAYDTQRKIEKYFSSNTDFSVSVKEGLFDLISNVILFEDEKNDGQHFHFRIGMEQSTSFANLDAYSQQQLKEMYVDYFYKRQDDFWKKEALHKLPVLKSSTNMLICGEDLGMVPNCVPDVMKGLGILSLEIQRMPKGEGSEFFHPANAPYLSVVTPSTHDMSTIRGWWEEDRNKTQVFYNTVMLRYGEAPKFAEPWIVKEILQQHLFSPAMWSIFQLQDILAINGTIRRENPNDERINIPADPNHFWKYRMHLALEELINAQALGNEFKEMIKESGRF